VFVAYSPSFNNSFVLYDDDRYIVDNPVVRGGLTLEGLRWAFSTVEASNWHPITWISHMIDMSLFGLNPGLHHMMGLALHIATAILVLMTLRAMTGALWPSVFATAFFALHPQRVESVVWAAERKDLLAGLFWVLAMLAYVHYVRKPSPRRFAPVVLAAAMSLLAKPVAVTLPFALLVLDWWPLGRVGLPWRPGGRRVLRGLLGEKLPLFLLSGLAVVVTLKVQGLGGATATLPHLSAAARLSNAVVSYGRYLGMTFWPGSLSPFYPHPEAAWPFASTAIAALLLATIGVLAFLLRRRAPAVGAGWVWFLGVLVPMIGLVQVGFQAMADRYTYLPSLGISMALVWGILRIARSVPVKNALILPSALACLLLLVQTRHQTGYWRDTNTIFGRALELDAGNWFAHMNYAAALDLQGRFKEAAWHYRQTLRSRPQDARAWSNLGVQLWKQGQPDEAINCFEKALAIDPELFTAHFNLGLLLSKKERPAEALPHLLAVTRRRPAHLAAHTALGSVFVALGRFGDAVESLHAALAIDPGSVEARYNLGVALIRQGNIEEGDKQLHLVPRQVPGPSPPRQRSRN
jgi:tetratricopeptide (TPR) repeat protein